MEYPVETVTVTILKGGRKAEIKIPVIMKMAGQLCKWYKSLDCHWSAMNFQSEGHALFRSKQLEVSS